MANRRMFSLDIVDTDKFLNMPLTSQALYFHLGMHADDDGFVSSPKKIMRSIGAQEDDLRLLITKDYIIPFESGVIVITHWYMQNKVQPTKKKDTVNINEFNKLEKENDIYKLKSKNPTICRQKVDVLTTQYSIGKDSTGKDSLKAPAGADAGQSPPDLKPSKTKTKNKVEEVDIEVITDYFGNDKVNAAFNEFLKARKELKVKNTPRSVTMLVNKLKPYPPEVQYNAITESIMSGWRGIFPDKYKNGQFNQGDIKIGSNERVQSYHESDSLDEAWLWKE